MNTFTLAAIENSFTVIKKNHLSMVERCSVTRRSRHLIFQNAPKVGSAGVGTVDKRSWLPRYHWAGPSTSLDEFTIRPILSYFQGQVNLESVGKR